MNGMLKRNGASRNLLLESRFETVAPGFPRKKSVSTQFIDKLQKAFELPAAHTEPEAMRALLRQIEAEFDAKR
jgi:hypothetical protein